MVQSPHAARRLRLAQTWQGPPILLPAGRAPSRNYAANTYSFRASSHFLYLVGCGIEGAYLLIEDDRATLFQPPAEPDDALWHGPGESLEELAERIGLDVRALQSDFALPPETATLPAVDDATRREQERILGRPVRRGIIEGQDDALARAMVELRLVHDQHAIAELRRAASATERAHRAGRAAVRAGVREHVVRAAMEHAFMAEGMTTAYPPIVTVHGHILHRHGYDDLLEPGDLLLADVGGETPSGWAADVTRTWPVDGTFSSTQRAIYDIVLDANRSAIEACRPGTRYREVHLQASRVIAKGLVELGILRGDPEELVADGVHALFFPHGVGHLLGLDVHDMEDLGDRAGYPSDRTRSSQFGLSNLRLDRDLEAGMAVTIEPGFYRVPAILSDAKLLQIARDRIDHDTLAKFSDVRGIRIEDDILVTDGPPENLSASVPK